MIFGDETRVLWGSEVIYDELDGIRFAISARSFYQVNPVQTVALYRKAVEYAGLTGTRRLSTRIAASGRSRCSWRGRRGQVYGVEIVPEAIEDARRNAALNGIANATFEVGRGRGRHPALAEGGYRAGCDRRRSAAQRLR